MVAGQKFRVQIDAHWISIIFHLKSARHCLAKRILKPKWMPNLIEILCRHLDVELIIAIFVFAKTAAAFSPYYKCRFIFWTTKWDILLVAKGFKCVAAKEIFNKIVNYAVIRLINWHFNVSKCSYGLNALENRKKWPRYK